MSSVVIVDSNCANLESIYKAARAVELNPYVSDNQGDIAGAKAVIFPGVGSFAHASSVIADKNLCDILLETISKNKPFLGICLGMQLLFPESEEAITSSHLAPGLGVITGKVKRFPSNLPVPHVGWNQVDPVIEHPLFDGLEGSYFYFTHSYYAEPKHKKNILAVTEYGFPFTSAVIKGNLFGVQFHPEKSGPAGLRLLTNFGKIIADHG